ncbi:MAG: hypothetical protein M3Z75_18575 [Actinomycetota bacterium]|nr:hypothetical protein [Actinomycetota bacterium]
MRDLPNVLLSPHTPGLSRHENERIMALFSENLRRYLAGTSCSPGRVIVQLAPAAREPAERP